jgi:hypothetical protein
MPKKQPVIAIVDDDASVRHLPPEPRQCDPSGTARTVR